jgi:two-component system NtrC family response regulator
VTSLKIPALRHRRIDIPALVEHFAEAVAIRHGTPKRRFTSELMQMLTNHSWPGNVRELRNVVEAIMILATREVVDLAALPSALLDDLQGEAADPLDKRHVHEVTLGGVERDAISAAIVGRRGNLTQVARDLNISRSTLYLKVKKHALNLVLNEARLAT